MKTALITGITGQNGRLQLSESTPCLHERCRAVAGSSEAQVFWPSFCCFVKNRQAERTIFAARSKVVRPSFEGRRKVEEKERVEG